MQRAVGIVMVLTAVAIAADLDVRLQTALAAHFPAIVVDPASALERSATVQRRLADLRGRRYSRRGGPAPSRLPVFGRAPDFFADPDGARAAALAAARGGRVLPSYEAVAERADVVVLCHGPSEMARIAAVVAPSLASSCPRLPERRSTSCATPIPAERCTRSLSTQPRRYDAASPS